MYTMDNYRDTMDIQKRGVVLMMKVAIKKWGNSHAIRLPKTLLDVLHADSNDELDVEISQNTIILKNAKDNENEELTIEELFADYSGESFKTDLQDLTPVGDEQW